MKSIGFDGFDVDMSLGKHLKRVNGEREKTVSLSIILSMMLPGDCHTTCTMAFGLDPAMKLRRGGGPSARWRAIMER